MLRVAASIASATAVSAVVFAAVVCGTAAAAAPSTLPFCGSYEAREASFPVPPHTKARKAANRCILQAAQRGTRARLAWSQSRIEYTIYHYLYVLGPKNILVVKDERLSWPVRRGWTRHTCTGLSLLSYGQLEATGCTLLGAGKPRWLTPRRWPRH